MCQNTIHNATSVNMALSALPKEVLLHHYTLTKKGTKAVTEAVPFQKVCSA